MIDITQTPHRLLAPVSGLYTRRDWLSTKTGFEKVVVESVRLDVDGWYPQMLASGTFSAAGYLSHGLVSWIASGLKEQSAGLWEGTIVRRWGDTHLLPHTVVRIQVPHRYISALGWKMTITFISGAPDATRELDFESPYFRTVDFEIDTVETAPSVTRVDTWAHPDRPSSLSREQLDIAEVYGRVGVDVQQSASPNQVGLEPGALAEQWTDQELHDAMQMFWSRYKPRAQWALWLLFAHLHVDPKVLGVMFDHNDRKSPPDPFQRQGAAVFSKRIAERLPAGETHPDAWLRRERFFAAVHELGHCFNLYHSWAKREGSPWAFDPGDPLAESFMNYPANVNRVTDFFAAFHYRFDDQEIAFIRHAPEEFVMMGANAFGQDHEFGEQVPIDPRFTLGLAVSRPRPVFEFLEPILVELKLTNATREPQLISTSILDDIHHLTLAIERRGGLVQEWRPYARYCSFGGVTQLRPGESLSTSLFASAGLGGWYVAEPGSYALRARLPISGGYVVADPLTLRVAAPRSHEEDYLAQSFFTDEVGRALAFGGTHVMTSALEALREATGRLPDRAVARHALLALALPLLEDRKVLRLPDGKTPMSSVGADGGGIACAKASPEEARRMLRDALQNDDLAAVATLGQIGYRRYSEMFASWLEESGEPSLVGGSPRTRSPGAAVSVRKGTRDKKR